MSQNQPLPRTIPIEEFLPLVGKMFELHCDPQNVAITLVEARPGRHRAFDDRPPYTLIFSSRLDILLADGLYTVKCGKFGPDTIFISSMLKPPGAAPGYYYQAVFN